MKLKNWAFTLVELLVVITILAIISVVAYQNFGGAVDKAVSGRKINDVATIETALQQYKVDKNHYPATDTFSPTNLWGYNSWTTATPSNKIVVTYNGEELATVNAALSIWGGKVYGTNTFATKQIGAKGTVSKSILGTYLSKDLYDPEIGDLRVADIWSGASGKFSELGIWRYIYATFKKQAGTGDWSGNLSGTHYNIAFTVKKDGSDKYVTKVVGDYDSESCYDDKANCPANLIGIAEGAEQTDTSENDNYGLPYAVTDFAAQ